MLRIYAAGGAAGNLSKKVTDLDVDVCFIDTSNSNLKDINGEHKFLVEGFDGAGKDRSISYEAFKPHVDDILIRFKPSDRLNIVISSLSGGSGSVIAPMITRELIKNGHNTIVIAIDSKHSLKELDNTVKTLKTYKSFADNTQKCISLFYIENNTRKEADQQAIRFINLMSLLVNKEHTSEFDTTDLSNFINYTRVSDNTPSVSIIDINANENGISEKNTTLVGTILVTTDQNATIAEPTPEYLATCIVTDPNYKNEDIRIDNLLGKLSIIVSNLESLIQKHQDNKKLNKHNDITVIANTDDGLIL